MNNKPQTLSGSGREGFFSRNALLSSGSIIAPAVAVAKDLPSAIVLSLVFGLVTLVTVYACSFVPRKLAYAIRIILYTLVASLVYVPVSMLLSMAFSANFSALGIYAPLLITNSLITVKTETKFYRLRRKYMIELAAVYVAGYIVSLLVFGTLRGILTYGTIFEYQILPVTIPTLDTLFGGLILLAVSGCVFRWAVRVVFGKEQK